jgi:hypothetical protein
MEGDRGPRAVEIVFGDDPARWQALGFALRDGTCTVGGVRLRFAPGSPGLREVRVDGLRADRPDGLALVGGAGAPPGGAAPAHPNGALAVDHVVAFTDDLARTAAAVEAAGLPLRRVRRPPEVPAPAAFLPAGTLVVEVVETGVPPSWWGLVVAVADIDAAVDGLAGLVGAPRAAVQAGRRIATVRPEAGLSAALALMTPRG